MFPHRPLPGSRTTVTTLQRSSRPRSCSGGGMAALNEARRYQDRAQVLLRQALERLPAGRRAAF